MTASDSGGSSPRARTCSRRPTRRGGRRSSASAPPGCGLAGRRGRASSCSPRLGAGIGTRTLAVYEERWATSPVGPLCVYLHGVHDPGNVGADAALRGGVRRRLRGLRAGHRRSVQPQGGAGEHGRDLQRPGCARVSRRRRRAGALPGTTIALAAGTGVELWRFSSEGLNSNAKHRRGSDAADRRRARRAAATTSSLRPTTPRTSRSRPTPSTPRWQPPSRCTR